MKKRVLAIALACMLLLPMLAACGGQSGSTGDADTIKIGGLAPLTGEVSQYGVAVNNGAKMKVEELNAAGGINGKQIDYVVYDEKGDATEAVNAYNRLLQDDKIVALVGDVTTQPTQAVAQQAAKDGIPMITASASALAVTTPGKNIFRACFTDPAQGEILASYAYEEMGAKTAAVIYDNGSDYSVGLMETFESKAKELGLEIVAKEAYNTGDKDFKAQLTNIKAANPDIVFIPDYYETVALIAVQAKDVGLTCPKIGADGWEGVLGKLDASNVDALEGCYYSSQFTKESTDEAMQNFYKNYTEKYGEEPTMFAALGYDAMGMMAQAIGEAGTTDSAEIVDAMTNIQYQGVTGSITFDENRNPTKTVFMISIEGGEYKFAGTYDAK